jgi:uncharacterized RDD family membrane protein YckC
MNNDYAGFWQRFAAYLIDSVVISCIEGFLVIPFLGIFGIGFASDFANINHLEEGDMISLIFSIIAAVFSFIILLYILLILYYTLMESSKYQATLGKQAMGLIVTDMNGGKLDFGQAFARNLSKLLSSMFFHIGYIIAAFTEKKQGLHDLIAGTLVLKKPTAQAT